MNFCLGSLNLPRDKAAGSWKLPEGRWLLGKRRWWKAQCPACWPSLQSQGSRGGKDVTDLAEDREDGGSGAQRDELKSPRSSLGSLPSVYIHADDVLKILKAFVRDFDKLR